MVIYNPWGRLVEIYVSGGKPEPMVYKQSERRLNDRLVDCAIRVNGLRAFWEFDTPKVCPNHLIN